MWKIALFSGVFFAMIALSADTVALEIKNPITSPTLQDLIVKLSEGLLKIVFILAPVFIIISGFRFLIASSTGNQAGLTMAKKLFMWTLAGTAIIVGASVIATVIVNFAKGL
ncbi:MAG: hypothetical protein A2131_02530 [Candidatus Sungbacteria bacterium GWC2_49_10]|uniref:Uncharacterized protein n=1 Tax=Candidatus Sungbacteria bacterium GWC2_49_10 TaxID=1802263 RepID=A0A1G2K3P0_9BACT|nr:MAG: hypothetical protein A2131_02530 [Candidatus Sungbacteria bacterium GWC2_49_10]